MQTIYRTAAVDDGHRGLGNGRLPDARSPIDDRADAASATSTCATRKLVENAPKWADEAVQKLTAKSVDVGRYDLVLHPTHLWLTIHESVAHPTELDRAMGYEANYAGTSFVAPPEKVLGTLKYGSELMNIHGDRTQAGSLSACGWDDEGVKPEDFDIIKNGIVRRLPDHARAGALARLVLQEAGQADALARLLVRADLGRRPVPAHAQRLAAARARRISAGTISSPPPIAASRSSATARFSIDQQRYNAQFGGQVFYEIKGGKIVGMLKDVAYQMRTPEFWASLDMIGGQKSYHLGGAFSDAKGQPAQVNAVSHGCAPSRASATSTSSTPGRTA